MRRRFLLAVAALTLTGCGGGGPTTIIDPPLEARSFEGTYGYAAFTGRNGDEFNFGGISIAESLWGRLVASDDGTWLRTEEHENHNGEVDPIVLIGGDPTQRWAMTAPLELERGSNRIGTLRDDGVVGASIQFLAPGVEIFTRPGGQLLPGEYFIAFFARSNEEDGAAWGSLALTDDGRVINGVLSANTNGNVVNDFPLADQTYTTSADGSFELAFGTSNFVGTVSPGSQFAVFGGSSVDGQNFQAVGVLVRRSASATNAQFSGTYQGVSIKATTGGSSWTARRRTLVADGAGSFQSADGAGSSDGRLELPRSLGAAQDYAVGPGGDITTPNLVGIVSPDGRTVVLTGRLVTNTTPTFEFLIR